MPYADAEQRRAYHREYMKKRRDSSPEQRAYDASNMKRWIEENPEKNLKRHYTWRANNPEAWAEMKRRDHFRRQEHKKSQYSGVGLINTLIEVFYDTRDIMTEITGEEHHVDHVKPLSKGGQHVPWNLQVLTATENLRKHNKYGI